MTEKEWDKKLKIETNGRMDGHADEYHHPYEPTPYCVLERLAESEYISNENIVIDYGCGKGRVGFFLHGRVGCKVIGIDFDERMCQAARQNLQNFEMEARRKNVELEHKEIVKNGSDIKFLCESAEKFEVEDADVFYFFNPLTF